MKISQEARAMIAAEFRAQGPAWGNLANSIEAGFENLWLVPSLKAIDRALQSGPQDPEYATARPPS